MKLLFQSGALALLLAGALAAQDEPGGGGTGGGGAGDPGTPAADAALPTPCAAGTNPNILSASDVCTAVMNAASAVNSPLVIAVTDRQGNILAVYRKAGAPTTAIGNYGNVVDANELAVALARTASFFSNNQAPLTSRTVRFISGVHFPPGIMFTANADLYGIENTNRGCDFNTTFLPGQFIPRASSIFDPNKAGLGILTGKKDIFDSDGAAVNPSGVPLFKVVNGQNVITGGIGVVGPNFAISEYAAAVAAISPPFTINPAPPGVVIVGGIALPEIFQTSMPAGSSPETPVGDYLPIPNVNGLAPALVGQAQASPGFAPDGELIPVKAGSALSAGEVQSIINNALATANSIRGVIRLPLGARSRMVIAVADVDGTLLGLYRMIDATIFSIDVAVAKSRNVIYFSNHPGDDLAGIKAGTAVSNRTISFGTQPFFPPGIDYSDPAPLFPTPGPFFNLFKFDTANPCTQGADPPVTGFIQGGTHNGNKSGIVFFPGAVPLYKNGVIVGGLGISGDGVDQDDYVTAGGAAGFEAPAAVRADQIFIRGVRMPYQKFPRNPTN